MSKLKKLEEGLADLFSSRIDREARRPEDEPSLDQVLEAEQEEWKDAGTPEAVRDAPGPIPMDQSVPYPEPDTTAAVPGEERAFGEDSYPEEETAVEQWIAQHPDANQDLKAFVEAVREMPQLVKEEEEDSPANNVEVERDVERYVVFDLGETTFGVEVYSVLTIIKMLPICPVPHSTSYISGLINLRGQVIPVLDLAKRIGIAHRDETEHERIVVVEKEKRLFGLTVDRVRSVAQIPIDQIREPSRVITKVQEEYLSGIAETEYGLVLLLALERLLQR